jgi:hypothetical protein
MIVVMISIGVFGPNTNGLALEEISAKSPDAAPGRPLAAHGA